MNMAALSQGAHRLVRNRNLQPRRGREIDNHTGKGRQKAQRERLMSLKEFYLWESLLVLLTKPADPPSFAQVHCFAVIHDTVICVTVRQVRLVTGRMRTT